MDIKDKNRDNIVITRKQTLKYIYRLKIGFSEDETTMNTKETSMQNK